MACAYYLPHRKHKESYVLTPVCHSVHRGVRQIPQKAGGQCAVSMHPTGMHYCFHTIFCAPDWNGGS